MKLLFNIETESASELHEILGFVDADFSTAQVLPYITKASREIFNLIGENNYTIALDIYETPGEIVDPFLILLRYTIALGAFRQFVPLLDTAVTTNGRGYRADDHLQAASEWRIDKSDDAMERSYYASIDEILTHIVTNADFETSPNVQKTKELLVNSLSVFQDFVNINDSHLLFFKLAPSLRLAEDQLLKSRTGNKFVTYSAANNTPINSLMKNICVYFAMADGIQKNSVQLFPRGVVTEVPTRAKFGPATRVDIESTSLYYKDQMNILLHALETEIKKDKAVISTRTPLNFTIEDGFVSM